MLRSNDLRLEFMDLHGFKRFSSSKVPQDKRHLKDSTLDAKKLLTYYCYYIGSKSAADHLNYLTLMKMALGNFWDFKTLIDSQGEFHHGFTEDDLEMLCGHGPNLFVHYLTVNVTEIITDPADKKIKKQALLIIYEMRDLLHGWKDRLKPFSILLKSSSPVKKKKKVAASVEENDDDIIVIE